MPLPNNAVVHLVRLGLNGDSASVRQYARRLLRKLNGADPDASGLRAELTKLLMSSAEPSPARRLAVDAGKPINGDSFVQLLRTEAAVETEAPVLSPPEAHRVHEVLLERRQREDLTAAGLEPVRTVLLTGPPGVGKTMTARHIASELGLPLHTLDLAAVMSSFLGRTGQNLRAVLDFAREQECVLLLDEFNAVAKRRDDPADVGELKRIVNVLLLDLETWPPHGMLVAATNHPELLDRAVWRRFDCVLNLQLPELSARTAILRQSLENAGLQASEEAIDLCASSMDGASGATLHQLVLRAAKVALLHGVPPKQALAEECLAYLKSNGMTDQEAKVQFCLIARDVLGLSQRATAALLGTSHVTVGKLLRSAA